MQLINTPTASTSSYLADNIEEINKLNSTFSAQLVTLTNLLNKLHNSFDTPLLPTDNISPNSFSAALIDETVKYTNNLTMLGALIENLYKVI